MPRATTYWETLRHLRPVQFYGRVWYKFFRPPIDRSSAPPVSRHEGLWAGSISRSPSMEGPVQFRFLNHLYSLPDTGGWEEKSLERLWLYNLHYFDDLNAENARERTAWHGELINRWIVENEPGKGTGWEPYPTSLRIVNWIKWALAENSLDPEWLHSLAIQTRWLQQRLERYLMGNHLFANAKALIFAGAYFKGLEADGWLKTGLQILDREIPEQVLEDGAHFELSPMYHRIILEDLLDLVNLTTVHHSQFSKEITESLKKCSQKMLRWMAAMSHPDGEMAFFNDSAMGIAASQISLEGYARRVGLEIVKTNAGPYIQLSDSGFFRWEQGPAVLIGDIGKIGPDYIPGHGHADTLSFELSLGNQRVLVNSGTSLYEESPERLRQRGTSAHNTVEIDGENSSEIWKSFRVARRAKPYDLSIKKHDGNWLELACSHDGYQRLKGRNVHRRTWQLERDKLVVKDVITGPFESAVARFHLHPEIKATGNDLLLPNGAIIRFAGEGGELQLVDVTWHPEFGKSIPSQCIELHIKASNVSICFEWN